MKTHILLFAVLIFNILLLSGAEADSSFNEILLDSDAVVLIDDVKFSIHNNNEAELFGHVKILIKNESAEDYAIIKLHESAFKEVTDIEAFVLDTSGKIITELEDDDILQIPAREGYVMYSDATVKLIDLRQDEYPYMRYCRHKLRS